MPLPAPFALTAPPSGSRFRIDRDHQGQYRVSWPLPEKGGGFGHWSDVGCSALMILFMLMMLCTGLAGVGGKAESAFGFLCCSGLMLIPIVGLFPRVVLSFRPPLPVGIIFGQYELYHVPGRARTYREKGFFADWVEMFAGGPRTRPFKPEAKQVRIDRLGQRQRLTVDMGAERLELGSVLSEPEREWLAANIQAWIQQVPEVPIVLDPGSTGIQTRPGRQP